MRTRVCSAVVLGFAFVFAPAVLAQRVPSRVDKARQLEHLVSQLQTTPNDQNLRQQIIELANSMQPPPRVPEQVNELYGAAVQAMKAAAKPGDYAPAVKAFKKASLLAPWVPAIYYNLGVAQEKARQYNAAVASFRLYLLAAPYASDAAEVEEKIGADQAAVESIAGALEHVRNFWPKYLPCEEETEPCAPSTLMGNAPVAAIRTAAAAGDAQAEDLMGELTYNGFAGVTQDQTDGLKWWRKAAKQGNPQAQYNLGSAYRTGTGVGQDFAEALHWYRKAASQGEAVSENDMGYMYETGEGVAQDYGQAMIWYRRAADQGNASAESNLGMMYSKGEGVPRDDATAVSWSRKSAEGGNALGENNLGWFYEHGLGVGQDYLAAAHWFREAASQGLPSAEENLGWLYEEGEGVPKSKVQAIYWYREAAEQGNPAAEKDLARLGVTP